MSEGRAAEPLFSIITVVYNAAETVRDTIESVLSQSYTNYEYTVIDGASTDGTTEILEQYREHFAYFVSEPDNGIYDAMNKGLAKAGGAYVYYLNGDDVLVNEHVLAKIASLLEGADFSPDLITGEVDVNYGSYSVRHRAELTERNLKRAVMPPHQGLFVRTSLMRDLSGFDSSIRSSADFELLCRVGVRNPRIASTDLLVGYMRAGGTSSEKKISYRETARLLRAHFGLLCSLRYWVRKVLLEQGIKRFLLTLLPRGLFERIRRWYLSRQASASAGKEATKYRKLTL